MYTLVALEGTMVDGSLMESSYQSLIADVISELDVDSDLFGQPDTTPVVNGLDTVRKVAELFNLNPDEVLALMRERLDGYRKFLTVESRVATPPAWITEAKRRGESPLKRILALAHERGGQVMMMSQYPREFAQFYAELAGLGGYHRADALFGVERYAIAQSRHPDSLVAAELAALERKEAAKGSRVLLIGSDSDLVARSYKLTEAGYDVRHRVFENTGENQVFEAQRLIEEFVGIASLAA